MTSLSRSQLGYLKLCGFVQLLRIRCENPSWEVLSLRSQDPGWVTSRLWSWSGYFKFCGFVVKIPVGNPQILWLYGQDPRLGYLKFCYFELKIPVGMPQILWLVAKMPIRIPRVLQLRGQDPDWDTSNFVVSWSRSRLVYLKF